MPADRGVTDVSGLALARPQRLCAESDLGEAEVKRVVLADGRALAVYRIDGQFFATDDTCTHGAASLADGYIEDGQIECPFHSGRFEIRTGQPSAHPCTEALRTYKVTVENGAVFAQDV
jgi:p-cumate 2,3-dioxygenase ferredoxin subunit